MSKTCTSCGRTYADDMVFCPADATTLMADEAEGDLIGTVIADRYQVLKLLGEGGMGKVYLAKHVRLPQQAAIKVLHLDMVKDSGALTRFNREAENAARIEHERVARVFDFGETRDGVVYIAMEFVPGVTLRGLLDESPRLTPVRAANIVYQVAEGLEAAHRLSIVHRDLKPDNVLVITDDGGSDRCKVVDFGIAKVTNGSETQLTQVGMLVGTPEFMSPEQVLGEQLDGRSDVYALALVAFELFAGGLPFEGNTPERKLTARLIQDPKTLAEVAPDVDWPEDLQEAFNNALVREPENRTASAMEFADSIINAVERWTGMSVLRPRTPMSTAAIVNSANESTGVIARQAPTASSAAPPRAAAPTAPTQAPPTASTRSATPGASTSASKVAIPEPAPKKSPIAAIAAGVLVVLAAGGYFMFGRNNSSEAASPPVAGAEAPATPNTTSPNPASGTPTNGNPNAGVAANVAAKTAPSGAASAPVSAGKSDAPPVQPVSPAPTAAAPSGVSAAQALAAQRELSSVRKSLENAPDGQEAVIGSRSVSQLIALLPQLNNPTDSTWALHGLAMAYGYAEHPEKSCQPLRDARRIATSEQQRQAISQLFGALTCAP